MVHWVSYTLYFLLYKVHAYVLLLLFNLFFLLFLVWIKWSECLWVKIDYLGWCPKFVTCWLVLIVFWVREKSFKYCKYLVLIFPICMSNLWLDYQLLRVRLPWKWPLRLILEGVSSEFLILLLLLQFEIPLDGFSLFLNIALVLMLDVRKEVHSNSVLFKRWKVRVFTQL